MPNQDEMRKKLDEMLLQKAGLTKVAPGSYRNLTSLPIEDLKAQLVGQPQQSNVPAIQQDFAEQLKNVTPTLSSPTGQLLDKLSKAANASTEEQRAEVLRKYDTAAGSDFDKMIEDIKAKALHERVTKQYEAGLDKAKQILLDRLENHYGGSQYTEDQMKAASEMLEAHLKSQAEREKIDNAFKMQELKNQGLIEAAGAKAAGSRQLPLTQLDSLSKNVAAIKQADDLLSSINENRGQFGVGIGFINANNPWNTTGRDLQASLEKVAYELWRQIDPRLSDQDAKRAAKQVGGLNDPVELVIARINNLKEEAVRKLNENINSYAGYGYTIPQNITDFANTIKTAQENTEASSSDIQVFQDANGNKARVRVDKNGNPVEVIEEL